jgi:hypothetical protein
MTNCPYPAHIYDKQRYQLALDILEKEFSKLLPETVHSAWPQVKQDIEGWAESPHKYHLDDQVFLDFWDIFAAVMESIKLKPAFTKLLTAENYSYHKKVVKIDDIHMSSALWQLTKIPGLNLRNDISFTEIRKALNGKPVLLKEQRDINDQHSTDSNQDEYLVIVKLSENGRMQVLDGNRRCLRALLYGKKTISAWVVETNGQSPENYWVPINDLMQLVELYKMTKKKHQDKYALHIRQSLEAYFNLSKIARINYETHILASNHTGAQELFDEPLE